jgi:hypothetical protein
MIALTQKHAAGQLAFLSLCTSWQRLTLDACTLFWCRLPLWLACLPQVVRHVQQQPLLTQQALGFITQAYPNRCWRVWQPAQQQEQQVGSSRQVNPQTMAGFHAAHVNQHKMHHIPLPWHDTPLVFLGYSVHSCCHSLRANSSTCSVLPVQI